MALKVPEIWFKAQRVLRTFVQVGIPAFLSFAFVLPLIIEAAGLPVESELRLWLLAVAAGVTGIATALARIMAIPQVNAWLTRFGLGSVPASVAPLLAEAESLDADEGEPVGELNSDAYAVAKLSPIDTGSARG